MTFKIMIPVEIIDLYASTYSGVVSGFDSYMILAKMKLNAKAKPAKTKYITPKVGLSFF